MIDEASSWFNVCWKIPKEAYEESMHVCANKSSGIPQWYVADGRLSNRWRTGGNR